MPEMTVTVRWPDGTEAPLYSPSLVMHDYLETGAEYPIAEFARRSSEALQIASARVRARYGFECTSALQQEREILATVDRLGDGTVQVLAMDPALPAAEPAS